ncbi:MAG: HD family phosphohydrolase [Microbacter sp.]
MKKSLLTVKRDMVSKIVLFVLAIVVMVALFPRGNHFNYHYAVGKPWHYGLVTASFDLPVQKDPLQLQRERDSVLRAYAPYFEMNDTLVHAELKSLRNNDFGHLPDVAGYKHYLEQALIDVYNKGIMKSDDYDKFKSQYGFVHIIKSKVAVKVFFKDLFTVTSAYEFIVNHLPDGFKKDDFISLNINQYIVPNLRYDSLVSNQTRLNLLRSVSETSGLVQAGERIIDRGDIVTDSAYRVLNSLQLANSNMHETSRQSWLMVGGEALLVTLLMSLLFLYIYLFRRREIFSRFKNVLFIILMIVFMVTLTFLIVSLTSLSIYIIPFALLPIIINTFFDARSALYAHIITVLLISFVVPSSPFVFIILQITAGMTVVSSLQDMTQRSQLVKTAALIFVTYSVVYVAITLIQDQSFGKIQWINFLYFGLNTLLLLFAYAFIYLIEKSFGFLSNVTLIELSNVNSPLLVQFSEQAPGTFQHSLQVSNLATEAAQKINANSLLVRTGALYHDIGKMANPMYFIENQTNGMNPLNELSDEEAAQIIINHVTDGVRIARKYKLPWQIIQFIRTHHGRSKVKYFYMRCLKCNPNSTVDERIFTYPGPTPSSKEMAVLMMADAVEASSRTLSEYTDESIGILVDNIIRDQMVEGAFQDAPITFKDIETVKSVFKEKLRNMYHHRIVYPSSIEPEED